MNDVLPNQQSLNHPSLFLVYKNILGILLHLLLQSDNRLNGLQKGLKYSSVAITQMTTSLLCTGVTIKRGTAVKVFNYISVRLYRCHKGTPLPNETKLNLQSRSSTSSCSPVQNCDQWITTRISYASKLKFPRIKEEAEFTDGNHMIILQVNLSENLRFQRTILAVCVFWTQTIILTRCWATYELCIRDA
ncbi:hypothetical protein Bhyg_14895 [Pseudolycoriella hygida]|uniref:Uncharacterized protein n=1 Tax=Pseudolycoriella hygida TaxID=35572 RepID=A0A9Q0MTX9_9DIPT|nr:hypothetical protein Bhyg_14895 [Pseudolycoriella hygida]